jgi:hypothetical protein
VSVALLDINVLVALFDPEHVHHEAAHRWLAANRASGWASCPLTENGFVRVVSNKGYPGRRTEVADAIARLRVFRHSGDHHFWAEGLTLCDEGLFRPEHVAGPQQITDVYLLGLAVARKGRLVTFDRSINVRAAQGADSGRLLVLGTDEPAPA